MSSSSTSGPRAPRTALVDGQGIVHDASSSQIQLYLPRPGWVEQDPRGLVGHHRGRHRGRHGSQPQGEHRGSPCGRPDAGIVALGASGASLTARSAIWCDKRCLDQVNAFERRPDSEEFSRLAGNRP